MDANNSRQDNMNKGSSVIELGSTDYGKVTVEGPYGNLSSPSKVAYVTGVHPLEFASHRAVYEGVKERDGSLNYCYYIYRVQVTRDGDDYDSGRMNGQLLASKFAVPHIIEQNYNLLIDVHSNQGKWEYSIKRFVFTPGDNEISKEMAMQIIDQIPDLVYFNPSSQTSTQYVTIPIIKAGKPVIVYETYLYHPYEITKKHALEFVDTVDRIRF